MFIRFNLFHMFMFCVLVKCSAKRVNCNEILCVKQFQKDD